MEVIFDRLWLFIVLWILGVVIGYLLARIFHGDKPNGFIVVEPVEDEEEDRERIRFMLDMDLDTIKLQRKLIFQVEDKTSKNSQTV